MSITCAKIIKCNFQIFRIFPFLALNRDVQEVGGDVFGGSSRTRTLFQRAVGKQAPLPPSRIQVIHGCSEDCANHRTSVPSSRMRGPGRCWMSPLKAIPVARPAIRPRGRPVSRSPELPEENGIGSIQSLSASAAVTWRAPAFRKDRCQPIRQSHPRPLSPWSGAGSPRPCVTAPASPIRPHQTNPTGGPAGKRAPPSIRDGCCTDPKPCALQNAVVTPDGSSTTRGATGRRTGNRGYCLRIRPLPGGVVNGDNRSRSRSRLAQTLPCAWGCDLFPVSW